MGSSDEEGPFTPLAPTTMADQRQQPPVHAEADLTESLETTSALPAPSSRADAIAHIAPPSSPPARRPHFSSFQSDTTAVEQSIPLIEEEDEEEEHVADTVHRQTPSGLGIDASTTPQTARRVSMQPVSRKFTSSTAKSPSIKSTPVFSPPTSAGPFFTTFPQSSAENTPDLRRERSSPDIGTFEQFRQGVLKNRSNTSINDYENFLHTSDSERLRGAPSVRSAYENDFHPSHECPTAKDFYQSRFTWLNMSIMVICLFSCVFSGIFLGLAIQAPHYGRKISSQGSFKPKDAILLTSIMAKLIEISFVTGFVSFLGQVLSRRAFMKDDGRGVTLSELSMWRWVVQPGTLITHWETAKYAGLTLLGILSLLSALLATLYSSAAVALVQPVLRDGYWDEGLVLAGNVKSDFANVVHVKNLCKTPIKNDKEEQGSTCLQIEHAGQGFHNFHRWLAGWDGIQAFGNGTDDLSGRPQGFGLLYENTTVTAQWIEVTNTTTRSAELGRVINNVSLAMPHSGVFAAARDQRNGIMQPEELDSEGTYSLVASVPSPVMHALCVNMNKDELAPIIFNTWPGRESLNVSDWDNAKANATTTNKTVVDDIFGWNDGQDINLPPVFPKYPMPFNTIMNHTSFKWGRSAIYMLGQGGKMDNADTTGTYALCKLSVTINSNCSTRYNVTGSGGTMEALCEERAGRMAFKNSDPAAPSSIDVPNWRDIGFDWSNALQLNTGIVDAKASNARLLTQLILQPASTDPLQVTLNKALPSLSEALAVLSGCTLLKAMLDAPFVMSWVGLSSRSLFCSSVPGYIFFSIYIFEADTF